MDNRGSVTNTADLGEKAQAGVLPANTDFTPETLTQLNALRQSSSGARSDGYLALMLIGRCGWTPAQAGNFLGLDHQGVSAWYSHFIASKSVESLTGIPTPVRVPATV